MRRSSRGLGVLVVVVLRLLMAACVLLGLAFAYSGISTTLAWRHLIGQRVTVVVTDCRDLGRNGMDCRGTEVAGGHPGTRIDQLAYQPSSVGSRRTVWEYDDSAVVGTPWGELWFDLLTVVVLAAGCVWGVRHVRARRRRAAPSSDAGWY